MIRHPLDGRVELGEESRSRAIHIMWDAGNFYDFVRRGSTHRLNPLDVIWEI